MRRVHKFLALGSDRSQRDLLFVRSVASTAELGEVELLFAMLRERFERFGRRVFLLVIVDDQVKTGPVLHSENERLLIWVQPQFRDILAMDKPGPFDAAVGFAVKRITGTDQACLFPKGLDGQPVPTIVPKCSLLVKAVGLRHTQSGAWAGHVQVKGTGNAVPFASFEGRDNISAGRPPIGIDEAEPA